jgi:hypothetical protein
MIVKKFKGDTSFYYLIGSNEHAEVYWENSEFGLRLVFLDEKGWGWEDKFIKVLDTKKFLENHSKTIFDKVFDK